MTSGGFFDFDDEMHRYRKQFQTHIFLDHWMMPLCIGTMVLFTIACMIKIL